MHSIIIIHIFMLVNINRLKKAYFFRFYSQFIHIFARDIYEKWAFLSDIRILPHFGANPAITVESALRADIYLTVFEKLWYNGSYLIKKV